VHHLGQRGSRLSILCCDVEFRSLTAVLLSGLRHSPILLQDICQFFFNQIAITVSLCVLGMYALFDAHETSHCSFSVSQVLCTNWRFLLRYSWLVTRVKFSSRRWGQDSPVKAPTTILSLRQSLQDLSVERVIDVIDRMGAVSTAHANPPAVMRDFLSTNTLLFSILEFSAALLIPDLLSTR